VASQGVALEKLKLDVLVSDGVEPSAGDAACAFFVEVCPIENPVCRERILLRTYSTEDTLYRERIL
jgi:hypothetical protein